MTYRPAGHSPQTLLEAVFHVIDRVARKVVAFTPLGHGIRKVIRSPGEGLISWDHVGEIAGATLELQRDIPPAVSSHMTDQYQNMLEAAKRQVADYTGLRAEGLPETVRVFGQKDWIDANIASFRFLFDPISRKYLSAVEEAGRGTAERARRTANAVLTIQVGVIMGYLARNVLGQYDLSLPEPDRGGRLYVVEPNVNRVEREMALHPREFRQWITLHEVTHSFEFHCNDWLKGYLTSSMQEYLKTIDLRSVSRPDLLRNMRPAAARGNDALKAGGLISVIATPEQKDILLRLQAVMCILEGYSNHVMDGVGKTLLATYTTMKERFERRRETKSGAERLFQRLIGIDLKLQQYRLGQAFVDEVVEKEGISFLNHVWEGPDMLPVMDEINDPGRWIERVRGGQS